MARRGLLVALLALGLGACAPAGPRLEGAVLRGPMAVLLAHGGWMWAGGREGLWRLDPDSLEARQAPLDVRDVRGLEPGPGGALWVGHEGGLLLWSAPDAVPVPGVPPVRCLETDAEGVLRLGTDRGAGILDGFRYRPDPGLAQAVLALHRDGQGRLWAGFLGGVAVLEDGGWTRLGLDLPEPHVNAFCDDGRGGVWVGTGHHFAGGALRLAPGPWRTVERALRDDGLAGEKVRSLHLDRRGRLWVGSEYDGVAVQDGGSWKVRPHGEVRDIEEDAQGRIWLATGHGVFLAP